MSLLFSCRAGIVLVGPSGSGKTALTDWLAHATHRHCKFLAVPCADLVHKVCGVICCVVLCYLLCCVLWCGVMCCGVVCCGVVLRVVLCCDVLCCVENCVVESGLTCYE